MSAKPVPDFYQILISQKNVLIRYMTKKYKNNSLSDHEVYNCLQLKVTSDTLKF